MLSLFRHPVHRPLVPYGFFDVFNDFEPTYAESSSISQIENNDYVKIQIQKSNSDFKNYTINLEVGENGLKVLKIASENDKFEKVYEINPEVVDVEGITWKWYKDDNVLEVVIPKKTESEPKVEEGKVEPQAKEPQAEKEPKTIEARPASPKVKKNKKSHRREKQIKELAKLKERFLQLEAELANSSDSEEEQEQEPKHSPVLETVPDEEI